ncbi:hypothetical protein [Chryseobacterium sp. StRB126]|nr:hypothetical protein [Chryseobacterium sp. StRB126]
MIYFIYAKSGDLAEQGHIGLLLKINPKPYDFGLFMSTKLRDLS